MPIWYFFISRLITTRTSPVPLRAAPCPFLLVTTVKNLVAAECLQHGLTYETSRPFSHDRYRIAIKFIESLIVVTNSRGPSIEDFLALLSSRSENPGLVQLIDVFSFRWARSCHCTSTRKDEICLSSNRKTEVTSKKRKN